MSRHQGYVLHFAETFSGYNLNSGTRIELLKASLTINTVIEDKSENLAATRNLKCVLRGEAYTNANTSRWKHLNSIYSRKESFFTLNKWYLVYVLRGFVFYYSFDWISNSIVSLYIECIHPCTSMHRWALALLSLDYYNFHLSEKKMY